jgi:peptide/nickel transport system permease protein
MFAGVVVIESIFAWPGIGFYTVQSIPRTDFPAIAGVTIILGFMYVIVNTVVEVLQALADPRLTLA